MAKDPDDVPVGRYIFAAVSATLIGAGLVRFAYTALLPGLIDARWFPPAAVRTLAAANLVGYLLGAIFGRRLGNRFTNVWTLRAMELLAVGSLVACAFQPPLGMFFIWRLLSGLAGGTTVVIVAATVLPFVPDRRKGVVSGLLFLGIGLGIAISAVIIPPLMKLGLRETWLGLAAFCGLLTIATWTSWPAPNKPVAAPPIAAPKSNVGIMYVQFTLLALAPVAPMLFLVEYVAQELGLGGAAGSVCWLCYGAGAVVGPPLYGWITDAIGARTSLRVILAIQTIGLLSLIWLDSLIGLCALAVILGMFVSGVVPLILAWLRETNPGEVARQNLIWSHATVFYSSTQAIGGWVFSSILNHNGGAHSDLFASSAVAVALALAINLTIR